MNFTDALLEVVKGKKVRTLDMSKDVYLFRRDGRIYHRGISESEEESTHLILWTHWFDNGDDWEVIEDKCVCKVVCDRCGGVIE